MVTESLAWCAGYPYSWQPGYGAAEHAFGPGERSDLGWCHGDRDGTWARQCQDRGTGHWGCPSPAWSGVPSTADEGGAAGLPTDAGTPWLGHQSLLLPGGKVRHSPHLYPGNAGGFPLQWRGCPGGDRAPAYQWRQEIQFRHPGYRPAFLRHPSWWHLEPRRTVERPGGDAAGHGAWCCPVSQCHRELYPSAPAGRDSAEYPGRGCLGTDRPEGRLSPCSPVGRLPGPHGPPPAPDNALVSTDGWPQAGAVGQGYPGFRALGWAGHLRVRRNILYVTHLPRGRLCSGHHGQWWCIPGVDGGVRWL